VKVEFFIDGGEVGREICKVGEDLDGGDFWSVGWIWWGDWGHHPEGFYKVRAAATDDAGAVTISKPVRFRMHGPR
jgi:hypothetical protein